MESPPILRPAEIADAVEIARLSTALGYPVPVASVRTALERLLGSECHLVVVAPDGDGGLQGWATVERRWTLESGESAELTGLVVDAGARRRGVGRALVARAETWAAAAGFDRLRVRTNVARLESHPFYEGIGFRRTKTQHVYEKPIDRET